MPRPTILAVDDTTANLVALEAVLGAECDIVRAYSGHGAIDVLNSRQDIDLILMDVHMPKLDGFETAKLIKQMESARDIPIVFITAVYREDPWVRKGYDAGGIDYFSKPFDPELLRMKVGMYAGLKQKADFLRERERQLRISEELLKTAKALMSTFGNSGIGLIIMDDRGKVREMNEEVLRIFNVAPSTSTEPDGQAGFHQDEEWFVSVQLAAVVAAVVEGKRPERQTVGIRCGDGSRKTIACSISNLREVGSSGREVALLLQDLTHATKLEGDFEQRINRLITVHGRKESGTALRDTGVGGATV